ncbi:MAG: glycosyltransferase family 4 protein [Pirellulaceae bacterium]
MKIAQVSPLDESVPPHGYGGIERIVSYLTEELVRLGEDVTLFASGDSATEAKLIPIWDQATRLDADVTDTTPLHLAALAEVLHHAGELDIVHFHLDWIHFPAIRQEPIRSLTTLHNRIDLKELTPLFDEFQDIPVVSISQAQQQFAPALNWMGTVYHGLPLDAYDFHDKPSDYIAFLGRISPDKGVEEAIEIADGAGIRLRIAAKLDQDQQAYFETNVQPHVDAGRVEFIGEVNEEDKKGFLGNAIALVFPINWPEPFGLVMIESLACGTPVVAFRRGSVPEVLEDGTTGFICEDVESAIDRMGNIDELDRRTCGQQFEERFSVTRMAKDYLKIYNRLLVKSGR